MAGFTAIATGIGLATTAATTGMSFAQASKQKKAMRDAQRDAQSAMDEARKKLEVNVFAAQALNKEPYERQREALLSAGAQAIEAGVESERGAAATAGRVMMAQNEAQAQQAQAMNEDLMALENKQLEEQKRLNEIGLNLDLEEVAGNQQMAADFANMAAQSQAQGVQGIVNFAQQAAQAVPLYAKSSTPSNSSAQVGASIVRPQTQFDIGAASKGQLSQLTPSTSLTIPKPNVGPIQNLNTIGGGVNIQSPQLQGVGNLDYLNAFLPYGIVQDLPINTVNKVTKGKRKK